MILVLTAIDLRRIASGKQIKAKAITAVEQLKRNP